MFCAKNSSWHMARRNRCYFCFFLRTVKRNLAPSEMSTGRSQRVEAANMELDQVGNEEGSTEKKKRKRQRGGKGEKEMGGKR